MEWRIATTATPGTTPCSPYVPVFPRSRSLPQPDPEVVLVTMRPELASDLSPHLSPEKRHSYDIVFGPSRHPAERVAQQTQQHWGHAHCLMPQFSTPSSSSLKNSTAAASHTPCGKCEGHVGSLARLTLGPPLHAGAPEAAWQLPSWGREQTLPTAPAWMHGRADSAAGAREPSCTQQQSRMGWLQR